MACVLEAGESAGGALEGLAQRADALGGVGATAKPIDATEHIAGEAAGNEEAHNALLAADAKPSKGTKFTQKSGAGQGGWRTSET